MDLEETEARTDRAGEGRQQFSQQTNWSLKGYIDFIKLSLSLMQSRGYREPIRTKTNSTPNVIEIH
jgi:hypothetical protein